MTIAQHRDVSSVKGTQLGVSPNGGSSSTRMGSRSSTWQIQPRGPVQAPDPRGSRSVLQQPPGQGVHGHPGLRAPRAGGPQPGGTVPAGGSGPHQTQRGFLSQRRLPRQSGQRTRAGHGPGDLLGERIDHRASDGRHERRTRSTRPVGTSRLLSRSHPRSLPPCTAASTTTLPTTTSRQTRLPLRLPQDPGRCKRNREPAIGPIDPRCDIDAMARSTGARTRSIRAIRFRYRGEPADSRRTTTRDRQRYELPARPRIASC